jgi:predicted enzyme related to lactoylglutathione lyase
MTYKPKGECMAGHFIGHLEISTGNVKGSSHFYKELFGWNFEGMHTPMPDNPDFHYYMANLGNNTAGVAFAEADAPGIKPGTVIPYITTDDVEASLNKAVELGGKLMMPKMEIPGGGFIGLFEDPQGNVIGLLTPGQM